MKKIYKSKKLVFIIFLLFASSIIYYSIYYDKNQNEEYTSHLSPIEYKVRNISLSGEAALKKAELSSLTWYKDDLILLPQYPFKLGENPNGKIYKINKARILDYINGKDTNSIEPQKILIHGEGLARFNELGQGYESIAFNGEDVYLTIESYKNKLTQGFVIKGNINDEATKIELDSHSLTKINPQSNIFNLSDETILIFNNEIYTIYEGNGKNINSSPYISKFDSNLTPLGHIKFQNVEYRITDATTPEKDGKFWAINYMYSGDQEDLLPAEDEDFTKYGRGSSHKSSLTVERLLEFKIINNKIIRTETPPVNIELLKNGAGRNWEGLVKLGNYGFIIVSDYFPETILGYISYERN